MSYTNSLHNPRIGVLDFIHRTADWCLRGVGNKWRVSPWWLPGNVSSAQQALLHVLAAAHSDQLDLAPLVEQLADEHRRSSRWRFKQLAAKLRNGASTIDALEQTPDILTDTEITSLRLGLQSGNLGPTYQDLINARNDSGQLRIAWRRYLLYAAALLISIALMSSFLATFISPTLNEIMEELALEPTNPQRTLTNVAASGLFPLIVGLLVLLFIYLAVFMVRVPLQAFARRRIIGRFAPGSRHKLSTDLLAMLSLVLRSGRPVNSAISTLAKYHHHARTRQSLLFVRNEIEQGVSPWESFATVGLLPPEAAKALVACDSAKEQGWLLRQVVKWRRAKARYWRNLISIVAGPLFIVACGWLVFWNVLAVFSVLIKLILSLS